MHSAALASAIERYLADQLGLHVGVRASEGLVTIVGRVPSAEACEAITDVVAGLVPAYRVDNQLEIEVLLPDTDRPLQVREANGWWRDDGHDLADDERVPAGGPAQSEVEVALSAVTDLLEPVPIATHHRSAFVGDGRRLSVAWSRQPRRSAHRSRPLGE